MLDCSVMAQRNDPLDDLIVRNLRRFREEAGLTQAEASEDSGVAIDNLRRYEGGRVKAPVAALKRLVDVYGHSFDDLLEEDPPPADLTLRPPFRLILRGDEESIPSDVLAQISQAVKDANRTVLRRRRLERLGRG